MPLSLSAAFCIRRGNVRLDHPGRRDGSRRQVARSVLPVAQIGEV
jgi:hypothetical protein